MGGNGGWWIRFMVAMVFCELWRRKQTKIKMGIGEGVIGQKEKEREIVLSPKL